jgi:hypothetical protein
MKLARAVFRTNNVDHCARLCHASTVLGLATAVPRQARQPRNHAPLSRGSCTGRTFKPRRAQARRTGT